MNFLKGITYQIGILRFKNLTEEDAPNWPNLRNINDDMPKVLE